MSVHKIEVKKNRGHQSGVDERDFGKYATLGHAKVEDLNPAAIESNKDDGIAVRRASLVDNCNPYCLTPPWLDWHGVPRNCVQVVGNSAMRSLEQP
jgi:hypothetical protein